MIKTLEIGIKIEFTGNTWIIWKAHDKNFKYGSYYVLKSDGNIDLVIEKPGDVRVINDIK